MLHFLSFFNNNSRYKMPKSKSAPIYKPFYCWVTPDCDANKFAMVHTIEQAENMKIQQPIRAYGIC